MHLSADWAGETITWLKKHNVKTRPLLARLGLEADDLTFGRRVSARSFAEILDYGALQTRDEGFGLHRGAEFHVKNGGVLAYLASSAETVGEAIARYQRYAAVVSDGFSLELESNRSGVLLVLQVADPAWRTCRHLGEFIAARVVGAMRSITGTDLDPIAVNFLYPPTAATTAARDFFRCRIGHDPRGDTIKLARSALDLRIPTADSRLGQILQSYADRLLAQARSKNAISLAQDVQNVIVTRLASGKVSLRDVATEMRMSERTLRRRLLESDVKFGDLLDRVRFSLARRWLAESDLDLKHISFLLGYSEPAAFSRAYKRWTGKSPGRAR